MIGSPRCSNCLHWLLIRSNWASRSGCEVPSIVFLLARKETPRSCKISASADFLIWCPLEARASTRCARDLLVHWTKLIGSPLGCSSCSQSASSVASVSTRFFMPPPDWRRRSPGRYPSPASSSFKTRFTVLIETPTSALPPGSRFPFSVLLPQDTVSTASHSASGASVDILVQLRAVTYLL